MAGTDEAEVVVRCARRDLPSETVDRIGSLANGSLDWAETIRIARANGVLALLCQHLLSDELAGSQSERVANAEKRITRMRPRICIGATNSSRSSIDSNNGAFQRFPSSDRC